MGAKAVRKADADFTKFRVQKFMHLSHRAFQILKQRFYPFAKELPYGGKLQISTLLHKQVHPKLLLQLMNLAAYR
ncbi:hypothetical protein D3C85_1897420 [compost metagenome]